MKFNRTICENNFQLLYVGHLYYYLLQLFLDCFLVYFESFSLQSFHVLIFLYNRSVSVVQSLSSSYVISFNLMLAIEF
jgi:hypothetical protein